MYRESLYNINNDIKVHKYDKHTHAYTRKDMATLNLTYLIKKPKLKHVFREKQPQSNCSTHLPKTGISRKIGALLIKSVARKRAD